MKCTWKGRLRFPPLQLNGKVKITTSRAAKPHNCRKSYSEWIWKCEESAGGQQQDRIGLFVSVRGVFIEQVQKWRETAYDRYTGAVDKQPCQWQPVILSRWQLTGQLLCSSTSNTTDWLRAVPPRHGPLNQLMMSYHADRQPEDKNTYIHTYIQTINVAIRTTTTNG